jgi:magnesium-protoporphyrin O-methyltransferase
MATATYIARRAQLQTYFDRTAVDAWKRITSDAPVDRIRRTVREGRERMRRRLLDWLPSDLQGRRLLDAGCGTGALALEAARRGADVVAVDLSPTLIAHARENAAAERLRGRVTYHAGDMLELAKGRFDHVVAMDSLIHYDAPDMLRTLAHLAGVAEQSVLFTFVPRTAALALMHAVGRRFPRGHKSPAVAPLAEARLHRLIGQESALGRWTTGRTERISSAFYKSQALELVAGIGSEGTRSCCD